ncbi:MAG: pirin-like C-terminal cupin domain-containing protein, partial [Myxococcota bacterium]
RDSNGGGGLIEPGDVQWMTAASGIVHEEFQSRSFTERGGLFEMVQLWVNLPAAKKMSTPRYQPLRDGAFPRVSVGDVDARIIAGSIGAGGDRERKERGPARTHSDINVGDISLGDGAQARFRFADGTTTLLLALAGKVKAQRTVELNAGELLVLDRRKPGGVELTGIKSARVLVLNGAPLDEPVVAHGPVVMNTADDVRRAYADYHAGRMGHL